VWLGWRGSSGGFHLSTAAFGSGRVPHVRPSVHGPKTIFQMLSLHARGQSWSETADLSTALRGGGGVFGVFTPNKMCHTPRERSAVERSAVFLSYPRICSNSELANATTLYPQST
jgi:hypothetical protein